jgi:hypothetical protein
MTKPTLAASATAVAVRFARASSSTPKGKAQTANSAKKLRLMKVEAGCAPCGNGLAPVQNCRTAQPEAMSAPPWTHQASMGNRSREKVFSPSHTISANRNQRTASTPAR